VGLILSPDVADLALKTDNLRWKFVSWVAMKCQQLSQKKNRIAFFDSVLLRTGGASQATLSYFQKSHGYVCFSYVLHSS
jgi:hypothetical protein